jgi:Family of unknown function (DUF6427)
VLRFFRFNDPYRLLGLLFILIVIGLPLFVNSAEVTIQELKSFVLGEALNDGKSLYIQLVDDTAPFTAWISGWVDAMFGRSLTARQIIALLFVFFQASFFAILLINNKAYNENTYLPALIFGLLAFFSFDMLSLSPELLASTVLLFALNNLFKEIEFKVQRDEIVLNIGVYLGIASLFVFSYFVFLIGTLILLLLFTRFTVRKALLLVFGFVLPHALLITFYFFWDNHVFLFQHFYAPNLTLSTLTFVGLKSILILGSVPIAYFFFSLFMLNREAHFTKYQSQLLQVMFLWLIIALVEVVITRERTPHSFYTFIPPLAYFISHYLLLIRRKRIAEIMLWVLIIGLVTMGWAARTGRIKAIDYRTLFPLESPYESAIKEKRILVLDDGLSIYTQNKMASYFLNWNLSKKVFEHPEYFENITLIGQSFQIDAPDVIIDKNDLMKNVFERIPKLKLQYKREGKLYRKII